MHWRALFLGGLLAISGVSVISAQGLRPVQPPMMTRWGKEVSMDDGHAEYPRPTMVRSEWLNLNGEWEAGVTHRDQTNEGTFTGTILVPFPIEAPLSGMKRLFTEQQRLWYRRKFVVPSGWKGKRVWLHFEAVDWEAKVWINGKEMGVHRGGYDRFSFDITDALNSSGDQELLVSVFDPSDGGFQPRGKQALHPRDLFYTPCSGIWQTVWLEPVDSTFIESVKLVPDIDRGAIQATVTSQGETNDTSVEIIALDGGREVAKTTGLLGRELLLTIPQPKLWSPDSPFLYDLKIGLMHDRKKIDEVASYFGMRQISVGKDESGYPRLMLNHKRLFQLGTLDQGYWPDGIYTAPSDVALRSDIESMKQFGFNMCRKHVKIEPERWYYWCDKIGLLVWQDMPSGDRPAPAQVPELPRRPESAREFETELQHMLEDRGNHPSIVMWILFNQGWGQYDTPRLTDWVKKLDPSRLICDASGWQDRKTGDVRSLHQYPGPATPEHDGSRPCVLGECGALGLKIPDHMWHPPVMSDWNLTRFETQDMLTAGYETLMTNVRILEEKSGLSGAVVTEWTDVETQLDGFMTYDREIIKMPVERVRAANERVINAVIKATKK